MNKKYANRGVPRNKRPLKNIVYEIELVTLKSDINEDQKQRYEKYKYKDLGYIHLSYHYEEINPVYYIDGFITIDQLKEALTIKQFSKFAQGERTFILQRRINGKNIKKNE